MDVYRLLSLPQEIRLQIYESLITYAVNIIYSSPVQFEEVRQHAAVPPGKGIKKSSKLYKFIKRDGLCGITYKISRFPTFIDTTINASPSLLLVSKAFSSDIKLAAHLIRRQICNILNINITGTASYNKTYAPFSTPIASFDPQFLDLIASARHIFAGYGHNTAITANCIPNALAERITNVFMGYLTFDWDAPNKWSRVDDGLECEYGNYPSNSAFVELLKKFPNLKTLAMPAGQHGSKKDVSDRRQEWILMGIFLSLCDTHENFRSLEVVFRDRNQKVYFFDGLLLKNTAKGRRMWWEIAHVDILKDTEGPIKLSEQELEGRGRYWSMYDQQTDRYTAILMEGAVWRITKGENHDHSSIARMKEDERQLELARQLEEELEMQRMMRRQREKENQGIASESMAH
ncbi:hypothetical protein TWF694_010082 [Orbilia ellipsospora]|uniref:LAGLIDADG endonuclease n=1 Tax=Orbilia ellipsospora TaxID=2528407 RepID=A0AAV9XA02_9PEZI